MATFEKVDEFDASKEEWAQYEERLTQFFLANDIDSAAKKKAVLLAICYWTYGVQGSPKFVGSGQA